VDGHAAAAIGTFDADEWAPAGRNLASSARSQRQLCAESGRMQILRDPHVNVTQRHAARMGTAVVGTAHADGMEMSSRPAGPRCGQETAMKPFQRILVPVDFSVHSTEAMRRAAALSRSYGATLTLVHVFDPSAYALPEDFIVFAAPQLDRLTLQFEQQLDAMKDAALKLGVESVSTHLLRGTPAARIVKFAKDTDIDLIVMGTRGRTGARHLLLGSIAERVVRTAPCAVLTVKAALTETES
jgi:nucleotide-binding universal stress UspA family protein